jgi:hypothetical protein
MCPSVRNRAVVHVILVITTCLQVNTAAVVGSRCGGIFLTGQPVGRGAPPLETPEKNQQLDVGD